MPKLVLIILLAATSAIHAADAKKITYQDHVRPVFANRCLNCHNPDKKKGKLTKDGDIAAATYDVCVHGIVGCKA